MNGLKVKASEISVGKALEWAMYDEAGRLLLNKGQVIRNAQQLEALVERGLYRRIEDGKGRDETAKVIEDNTTPFQVLDDILQRLPKVFQNLLDKTDSAVDSVYRLCQSIQNICQAEPDACLGAVHLVHEGNYSVYHSLHVAILAELTASKLDHSAEERLDLIAACLTANISMLELQDVLFKFEGKLSQEQRTAIETHPVKSVEMLKAAGVTSQAWLDIVYQHHECCDGSGYPCGLKEADIMRPAMIACLSDRYAAMISERLYRKAQLSNEALRLFFHKKSSYSTEKLTLTFIKVLSIWPPGSCVILENGEIAIITRRGEGSMWPVVSSIISPRGGPYMKPIRRDCEIEEYRVKDIHTLKKNIPLNLSMIWGYC
jgi:HD-GYP domain-containing protein (c-di-GMP phosphodiesterase class II)